MKKIQRVACGFLSILFVLLTMTACADSQGDYTSSSSSLQAESSEAVSAVSPSQNGLANSQDNSHTLDSFPLRLQIIDERNGIFCLNDPDLKESYPISYENFEAFEEMHQWSVYLYGGNDEKLQMGVTLSNGLNYTGNGTAQYITSAENIIARYTDENDLLTSDAFPVAIQTVESNIYIKFTIPDSCGFDLTSASNVAYSIINAPSGIERFQGLVEGQSVDMIVVD